MEKIFEGTEMERIQYKWTEQLKTGLIWQDFQHQELLQQMKGLQEAIEKGDRELDGTKRYLEFYILNHFGIEEEYMKIFNYTDMESHLKEHAFFKKQLTQLYPSEHAFISGLTLCSDLYEWFQNHILTVDKKFADFIKASAAKEFKI